MDEQQAAEQVAQAEVSPREAAESEFNAAWEDASNVPEAGDPEFWSVRVPKTKRLLEAYEALMKFDHPVWITRVLIDGMYVTRDDLRKAVAETERARGVSQ